MVRLLQFAASLIVARVAKGLLSRLVARSESAAARRTSVAGSVIEIVVFALLAGGAKALREALSDSRKTAKKR